MSSGMSWGKANILAEALLLLALSFVYSIYLMVTEEMLGVLFLVLAFMSITAIFTNHYIQYDNKLKRRAKEIKKKQTQKKARSARAKADGAGAEEKRADRGKRKTGKGQKKAKDGGAAKSADD
jgi:multisubunit Na+/H+ antiporter MnhG subunit